MRWTIDGEEYLLNRVENWKKVLVMRRDLLHFRQPSPYAFGSFVDPPPSSDHHTAEESRDLEMHMMIPAHPWDHPSHQWSDETACLLLVDLDAAAEQSFVSSSLRSSYSEGRASGVQRGTNVPRGATALGPLLGVQRRYVQLLFSENKK